MTVVRSSSGLVCDDPELSHGFNFGKATRRSDDVRLYQWQFRPDSSSVETANSPPIMRKEVLTESATGDTMLARGSPSVCNPQ